MLKWVVSLLYPCATGNRGNQTSFGLCVPVTGPASDTHRRHTEVASRIIITVISKIVVPMVAPILLGLVGPIAGKSRMENKHDFAMSSLFHRALNLR